MTFALPTAPVLDVRALLERDGPQAVALRLLALHPVEVAEALDPLDPDQRFRVVSALPASVAAQVLLNADPEFRAGLLERASAESLAQILDRLPVEHAARILDQLAVERQHGVLASASTRDAAQMEAIRRCPPASVGRLMVRRVPRIRPEMTAAETFRYLRRHSAELQAVGNLYVLAPDRALCGVVALRELVEADSHALIGELMQTRVVMVTLETHREEAANLLSRYHFLALPVVDAQRRLLGAVTVDDLVDVLIKEHTEDALHMGAVSGGDESSARSAYWTGRIGGAVRSRIGWLLLLFAFQSATVALSRAFGGGLATGEIRQREALVLACYVPLVLATAGIAGSQALTTIVRGLATGEIRQREALRVVLREAVTGLLLGLALGVLGAGLAAAWGSGWRLAATVGATLPAVCLWSTALGGIAPVLARRLGVDATVISAPLITTVADVTSLPVFYLIARALLRA